MRPLENSLELVEQVADELRKLGECWHNRPTREGWRFTESYLNLGVRVCLIYVIEGSVEQYVAIYQRETLSWNDPYPHFGNVRREARSISEHPGEIKTETLVRGKRGDEQSVFIDDVEVVQDLDRFMVSSKVRLQRKTQVS